MGFGSGAPGRGPRSEINVTPLVDVVLVLLIIFLVIMPFTQTGVPVRLPGAPHVAPPAPVAMRLRVDAGDRIFLGGEEVRLADVAGRVRAELAGRASRLAIFSAADDASYAGVADVLDAVRAGGAETVGVVLGQR